jgi:hypothetical protein
MEETLESLIATLPVSRRRRKAIARELQGHLDDATLELTGAGWSRPDAELESLRRLGQPTEIVGAFADVYRPSRRRRRVGLAVGLAGVLLLGAYGGGNFASATSAHTTVTHVHASTSHHIPAARTR